MISDEYLARIASGGMHSIGMLLGLPDLKEEKRREYLQAAHETSRDMASELIGLREYLHDICDAYEAWKKLRDPDTNDGIVPDLEEAIEAACAARQEP